MTNVISYMPADDRLAAIKSRQQATWASGDFAVIGVTLQIVGELLNEAVDVQAADRVLDVAAGNGNATLAAARRFANVTSTDYVQALLERGRRRVEADGFDNVNFELADAEALPYPDAASTSSSRCSASCSRRITPAQRGAVSRVQAGRTHRPRELDAVGLPRTDAPPDREACTSGSRHPVTAHVGHRGASRALFPAAATIEHTTRTFAFRYRSAEHFVDVFRRFYGPMYQAFAALDADSQVALENELTGLLQSMNSNRSDGLVVHAEYLGTVIVR